MTTEEVYQVPSIAEDLEEVQRLHEFDCGNAPYQPEVLFFARAAERVAVELRRVPVTVTAEVLPGKVDPSAEARFANGSRAGQYARGLVESGDYMAVYLDDGETKWHVR